MKKINYQMGVLLLALTLGIPQIFQPLQILAQSNANSGEYLIEEALEFGSDALDSEDITVEESQPSETETEAETEEESEADTTIEEQTDLAEDTPTEATEDLEETASDNFIPEWLNHLMEEKSQNNTMLEVAYQDYQQIEERFDYLDIVALGEGSTYDFVLENFTFTHDNVEIMEETSDIGLSVVSFLYTAAEGDLNPERDIEDWAMIEFYFVTDILVYSSLSTMSLGFNADNTVTLETVNEWVDQAASVDVLADNNQFELNAFGQVLADGEFIYSLGMPIMEAVDFVGGLLAINNEQVFAANTVTLEDIEAVSFSPVMYVLLIQIVPNNVFMPADAADEEITAEAEELVETEIEDGLETEEAEIEEAQTEETVAETE